jgi:hypothetical protein
MTCTSAAPADWGLEVYALAYGPQGSRKCAGEVPRRVYNVFIHHAGIERAYQWVGRYGGDGRIRNHHPSLYASTVHFLHTLASGDAHGFVDRRFSLWPVSSTAPPGYSKGCS